MFRPQRSLAATDFSDPSAVALRMAARLAMQYEAELHVLHAEDPLLCAAAHVEHVDLSREAHEELCAFVQRAELPPALVTHLHVNGGPAAEVICAIANRERADVVVVGARGISGFRAGRLRLDSRRSAETKRSSSAAGSAYVAAAITDRFRFVRRRSSDRRRRLHRWFIPGSRRGVRAGASASDIVGTLARRSRAGGNPAMERPRYAGDGGGTRSRVRGTMTSRPSGRGWNAGVRTSRNGASRGDDCRRHFARIALPDSCARTSAAARLGRCTRCACRSCRIARPRSNVDVHGTGNTGLGAATCRYGSSASTASRNSFNVRSTLARPRRRAIGSISRPSSGGNLRLKPIVSTRMHTPPSSSTNRVNVFARHRNPLSCPSRSSRSRDDPAFFTWRICVAVPMDRAPRASCSYVTTVRVSSTAETSPASSLSRAST